MKLWEYMQGKMQAYAQRAAFAGSGITYADLLALKETGDGGRLKLCEGSTREEQALAILKCIAGGDVAVPVASDYGIKQYDFVRETVKCDSQIYDELAFLMFTSGTTGTPKGVMLTHENIITNLEYISSYFDLKDAKSICIGRPLVHIAVLTGELLYGLINGLRIYFYEEAFMPSRLISCLTENRIEVFCATPTLYSSLAHCMSKATPPIKVAAISGERLTKNTAAFISDRFPETRFYNVYGLTEHSPRVSALLPQEFIKKAGSVGKPIGDEQMTIEHGELLVKSPCVMKGYYKYEQKNKVKNGWLYTGDVAHTDEEGYYYIDGRKDDMMIRAGVNIFPQEIENVLKTFPGVEECQAYGVDDERYGQKVCVKVKGEVALSELRKFAAKNLPAHLVPNEYCLSDGFCYTPSGKLKRR